MMKEKLKERLKSIVFGKSNLTLNEQDFIRKRDYCSKIIDALDTYINNKHADDCTDETVHVAKMKLLEIIKEYEDENNNSGNSLCAIQVFRPIDGLFYTVGDMLCHEYYYKINADEYQNCIRRLNDRIAEAKKNIEIEKTDPSKKDKRFWSPRSNLRMYKKMLEYYSNLIKNLENES